MNEDDREQAVTDEVVASFARDDRLAEVMRSLVRHLHEFARDVRLTQAEWERGVEFLTRVGHRTDQRRQEFVLLSDVLGLSMLTVGINATAEPDATESTVFGPFFVDGAPGIELGGDITFGAKGRPCWVSGTVTSTSGAAIPGARIEVWEADADGFYDVQYGGERVAGRGWLSSGDAGEYRFWAVRPSSYGIPSDGPVGELLAAAGRHPMRPAHLHFMVTAPGHRTLITHVFVAGDEYLASDAVFGVKESLVVELTDHAPGPAPEGRVLDEPWTRLDFDIVLAPGHEST